MRRQLKWNLRRAIIGTVGAPTERPENEQTTLVGLPSFYINILAGVVFAGAAILRPFVLGSSRAGLAAAIALFFLGVLFFADEVHRVLPPESPSVGFLTFTSFVTAITAAYLADMATVTHGFENTPLHTVLDPLLGALVILLFFTTRFMLQPKALETCGRGTALDRHVPLQASSAFTIFAASAMTVPAALTVITRSGNSPSAAIALFVLSLVVGVVLLVLQGILDRSSRFHAYYKGLSLFATLLSVLGREVVIASTS